MKKTWVLIRYNNGHEHWMSQVDYEYWDGCHAIGEHKIMEYRDSEHEPLSKDCKKGETTNALTT